MKFDALVLSGTSRIALCSFAVALALGSPAVAVAQEVSEELAQPAGDLPMDEEVGNAIIVTATKREQTLQDVPVAVTVTTAETLERAEIRDLKDLQTVVPSLRVTQLNQSAATNFIIRGFGNGASNAGIEPSVGVFVDGVYRSRTASAISDLPDVQRIEVLRGPQSTLFGKNASAGVISISTNKPRFNLAGSVEASYGNYDATVLKGYLTGPLSDAVAVSIAGGLNKRDGYFEDLVTGNSTNERDRWFLRGQALIEATPELTVRLIADYDSIDENCCGVANLVPSVATQAIVAIGGQVNNFADRFENKVYNNFDSINKIENWGVSGQVDYNAGPLTLTSITSYRNTGSLASQDPDFSSADLINPLAFDVELDTFTQEIRAGFEVLDVFSALVGVFYINEQVEQTGQLTYGTQIRPYGDFLVQGLSGGALDLATLEGAFSLGDMTNYSGQFFSAESGVFESYSMDSEAFSIFGQVDAEITTGLTLTLGGNYTNDKKSFVTDSLSNDVFASIDLNAPQYAFFRNMLLYQGGLAQEVGAFLDLGRPASAAEIQNLAINNNATFAFISGQVQAFADANDNNPDVNPLAALADFQYLPPFVNVPNAVEGGKTNDENFSYTIRLSYDVSDNVNVYAGYATGFKASSVNLSRDSRPLASDALALAGAGLLVNNLSFGTRFADPEKSRVYELGLKGDWDIGSANVAVFQQEIEGFQSNIFTGTGFGLANAGKQSTFGVEFEGRLMPADGLTLNLGVTYLDPVYDDFEFSTVGDLSGTRPAGIPEWTVNIGADYVQPLANGDEIVLSTSFHHESDVQVVDGLPGFLAGGTAAAIAAAAPFRRSVDDLSASITYAAASGLQLSLWGRNLLDDRYLLSIFDTPAQPGSVSGYPNQPVTYGATARFKF